MTNIPGLSFCSNEGSGTMLELESFSGKISIPESHRFGHCRQLSDFPLVGTSHIEGQYGVIYKCKEVRTNQIYALKLYKVPIDSENALAAVLHDFCYRIILCVKGFNPSPILNTPLTEQCYEGVPRPILREISILKQLKNHPNIINSHGTVAGVELDRNYLILDYCEFTLKELIERNIEAIFDRAMIKFFMYHIILGLKFIHDGMIIHRDICSKNIMFTKKGVLKIGGFRTSRFFNRGNMTPGLTELNYRAPELIISPTEYHPAIDIWSAGCIFAELLLKKPLFTGTSELELLKSIFFYLGTPTEAVWPGYTALISKWGIDKGAFSVQNEMQFSQIQKIFINETAECRKLLLDFLIYFPPARVYADVCLAYPYFIEKPKGATCEDLAKVIQSLVPEM